jgi:pyruvate,orthophosphate dikinase
MRETLPEVHDELGDMLRRLERHYRDLCDVEFTVQEGRLQILQVRAGKRSAIAAARIAIDLANEGLISREEALRRVAPKQLRQLKSMARVREGATAIASGVAASPGVVSGVICLEPDRVAELVAGGLNVILVRPTTSPEDVQGMAQAAGIVTATGGMVSHAALVARGWGIAAVCGVEALRFGPALSIGGQALEAGARLTIDGTEGRIYLGDCVEAEQGEPVELKTLRRWAAESGLALGEDEGTAEPPINVADDDAACEICRRSSTGAAWLRHRRAHGNCTCRVAGRRQQGADVIATKLDRQGAARPSCDARGARVAVGSAQGGA